MRRCCQPPATRQFWGGWWTNPKGVGLNVSYLVSWQTAYQVAVERDHGRLTGYPEVETYDVVELQSSCRAKRKRALRGRNHAEGQPGDRIDALEIPARNTH